jgi:predicted MFS family arabinose efflux permease
VADWTEEIGGRQLGPSWPLLLVVVTAYLAITIAESVLAPLFPALAVDLGLDLSMAGTGLGLLTGAIAAGNLLGGVLLRRTQFAPIISTSLFVSAVGCVVAASAARATPFLVSQLLIGLGAGLFFAPGIQAVARLAGPSRRGLAMGIFGAAFSAGLAAAAFLAAAGAGGSWRIAFWAAGIACLAAMIPVLVARLPKVGLVIRSQGMSGTLGLPVLVGSVGTITQYGTVGFLAIYAVSSWSLSAAGAAALIAVARVLSVPGKLLVGGAADRFGSAVTLRVVALVLVITGAVWTLLPRSAAVLVSAVLFGATVSSLFPIANLMAVEKFGGHGDLLGRYRSVQIAIGAAATSVIGVVAEAVGLQRTLMVSALVPAILLAVKRDAAVKVSTT